MATVLTAMIFLVVAFAFMGAALTFAQYRKKQQSCCGYCLEKLWGGNSVGLEYQTFNLGVVGSSPTRPTKKNMLTCSSIGRAPFC